MKNEVEVLIRGSQHYGDDRDEEPLILRTGGVYRNVAGRHHVRYDEVIDGTTETTRNHVAISDRRVEVHKTGEVTTDMIFEEGMLHKTNYQTKFGTLTMYMKTKKLTVRERDDSVHATIYYTLLADEAVIAECTMEINVKSKT